jgi:hypothetical protein
LNPKVTTRSSYAYPGPGEAMSFCELRATIDAEKAVFHRIISGARKAVFGPGELSMREADAFVEALQHYQSERAVALTALTTHTKE